jgi:hypothetical protein
MQPALMTEKDVENAAKRLPFMQFPDRGLCAGAILKKLQAWASVKKQVPNALAIRRAALKAQEEYRTWQHRQEKSQSLTTSGEPSTPPGSETESPTNLIVLETLGGKSFIVPTTEPSSDLTSSFTPKPGQPSLTKPSRAVPSGTGGRKR